MRELNPASIAPPFARYSHGVSYKSEELVTILTSGQLGLAADGSIPDSAEAQADICFANILAILAEEGGSQTNVLRINAYVTDREHMAGYMLARDRWLADVDRLPASTLMIVGGFTRPEFKVEIEVLAGVGKVGSEAHRLRRWWRRRFG